MGRFPLAQRLYNRYTTGRQVFIAMRFWWVNQNQTFRQEQEGGYLWSPKRNANNAKNPFYETMREVAPGDIVFSFKDTLIQSIGVARSYCYECPKPPEFGQTGGNWNNIGWSVRIKWTQLIHKIRPKDFIEILRPHLPDRYSPLNTSGNGSQSVYLAEVPTSMADVLGGLIGVECSVLTQEIGTKDVSEHLLQSLPEVDDWEDYLQRTIVDNEALPPTTRTQLVQARRGQGLFKQRVCAIERRCRITQVNNPIHLVASHCKPWRDAADDERLDGENGLLLTPTADHLFDRGFISFEDNGDLLISPVADRSSLNRMGIEIVQSFNVGDFTSGQKHYLDYHRNSVFLQRR